MALAKLLLSLFVGTQEGKTSWNILLEKKATRTVWEQSPLEQ